MKCNKCNCNIKEESNFCNNCGVKIERPIHSNPLEVIDKDAMMWFILGFLWAVADKNEKFERIIRKKNPPLWSRYKEIVSYWTNRTIAYEENRNPLNLSTLAFQRLRELNYGLGEIVPFPKVMICLCRPLRIKKAVCWDILRDLEKENKIEIMPFHGIKLKNPESANNLL